LTQIVPNESGLHPRKEALKKPTSWLKQEVGSENFKAGKLLRTSNNPKPQINALASFL
jgi:hypothetical protein